MGIFDYFKKKHKQENSDIKPEIVEEPKIIPVKQPTTSMYDGISVEGELLRKVYPQFLALCRYFLVCVSF